MRPVRRRIGLNRGVADQARELLVTGVDGFEFLSYLRRHTSAISLGPAGDRRQKGHVITLVDLGRHRREVRVDGTGHRMRVFGHGRVSGDDTLPHVGGRRARRKVVLPFLTTRDLTKPRKELHRHAHDRSSASWRARRSVGSATAPSTQASPSSNNSCFHTGAICLTRSIAYRQAAHAAPRCAEPATMTMLASPISSRPIRWTRPSTVPGHTSATSSEICRNTLSANGTKA